MCSMRLLGFELGLARLQFLTELFHVHVGLSCSRKHPARLLLFLDVMLDHLREHLDLGIEVIILRTGRLDLGDQFLGLGMLNPRLVMHVGVARALEECRVEYLLFDLGMNLQRSADPGRHHIDPEFQGLVREQTELTEVRAVTVNTSGETVDWYQKDGAPKRLN